MWLILLPAQSMTTTSGTSTNTLSQNKRSASTCTLLEIAKRHLSLHNSQLLQNRIIIFHQYFQRLGPHLPRHRPRPLVQRLLSLVSQHRFPLLAPVRNVIITTMPATRFVMENHLDQNMLLRGHSQLLSNRPPLQVAVMTVKSGYVCKAISRRKPFLT